MPSAVLIADHNPPFTGWDFHEGGVGGNAAAVVILAEGLVELGFEVSVLTSSGTLAICRGVEYRPVTGAHSEIADLIVQFRLWSEVAARITSARRIYFVTDYPVQRVDLFEKALEWSTDLRFMSGFQLESLQSELKFALDRPTGVPGLPVCLTDYQEEPKEKCKALIYCSVPNRGLSYLPSLFRRIKRTVRDAELWITSDFTLWGGSAGREEYEQMFKGIPGVHYFGALPRPELVKLQNRARIMAYPCIFPEGFCLSAVECMAAGAVPVSTDRFAMTTTIGDGGKLIGGHPGQCRYDWSFARACIRLLKDESTWESQARLGRDRAFRLFSPKVVAQRMLSGESQPA